MCKQKKKKTKQKISTESDALGQDTRQIDSEVPDMCNLI